MLSGGQETCLLICIMSIEEVEERNLDTKEARVSWTQREGILHDVAMVWAHKQGHQHHCWLKERSRVFSFLN